PQPLDLVRPQLAGELNTNGAVGQRCSEFSDKTERLGAIGREPPRGDVCALTLADLDIAIDLKPAAQDALAVIFQVEHPTDLVQHERRLLPIDAAIDCCLAHAVGFLTPAAKPIEQRHEHGLAAAFGRRRYREVRRYVEASENPGVKDPKRQRHSGVRWEYNV